ncbi:MAG: tRNA (adenosine(37)-N6)-threonylcarbamoyltransferase complex transferase subunit TsaD [Spirochaetaceae bacterium]|jgi:N6-L-threonylcarbamoyladenine synthase|nr:tRNA (adenosine(37)-N6)-threonylcarbamoyltransferase complex transferase subunit TsaD [Spirochaetaceae bacterium]
MTVLGIETSCDECAAAVVEDGRIIRSNVIATQIPFHASYNGVVPEIASRKHTEWIDSVVQEALTRAELEPDALDAVAATAHPGLLGSLIVGVSFAKAFAWAKNRAFIAVDHILAHLYAAQLSCSVPDYPFLGLLVSGGHSIICRVDDFDTVSVLGASIDDAVGEAFDKVAKHYALGYPGGPALDKLAALGCDSAFDFPLPSLHKGEHRYDISYSGLKNAVINQLEQFRRTEQAYSTADIAASFQKTAVAILTRALFRAVEDTGITVVVAGGGVAANSLLRSTLADRDDLRCIFPSFELCTDNGAMVAGIAYHYLARGESSPLNTQVSARVSSFRRNIRSLP